MKQKSPKKDLNQLYRERYQKYRAMGYSPKDARKLRHRSDDTPITHISYESDHTPKASKTAPKSNGRTINRQNETQPRTQRSKTVQSQQSASSRTTTSKQRYNDVSRIRYQIYRDLGYSAKDARKLRHRTLDVGDVKVSKDGHIKKDSKAYKETVTFIKADKTVENYRDKMDRVPKDDSNYGGWGLYTQDVRYKDDTAKMVKQLQKTFKLTNEQAYYMLYYMITNKRNLKQTKRELLSTKEFEIYHAFKEGKI